MIGLVVIKNGCKGVREIHNQQITKVKQPIRPLFTVLIVIVIVFNLYATIDTIAKNRYARQVTVKLEKQVEKAEELQVESERLYEQSLEDNKRLDDLITRFHLHLDQLNRQ